MSQQLIILQQIDKMQWQLIFTVTLAISLLMGQLVSNAATCLKIAGDNTYVIDYVVSGENNKAVKMQVFNNDQFITRKQGVNEFTITLKFSPGFGQICFQRTDGKQKSISFDYYPEKDPVRQIIDKKDISIAMKSLNDAVFSMKQVGRNQKFHIQRNQINRVILQKSENKIKWAGIIKIFFLITSALIQLWIMKSFFNKNSVPYQPIEQH